MRKSLVLLVFIMFFSIVSESQNVKNEVIPDVITVIHNRKSVRQFTEQKVDRNMLEVLLRAGMAAPTAVNKQPWFFVAVDERETLSFLSENLNNNPILKRAQASFTVGRVPNPWSCFPTRLP